MRTFFSRFSMVAGITAACATGEVKDFEPGMLCIDEGCGGESSDRDAGEVPSEAGQSNGSGGAPGGQPGSISGGGSSEEPEGGSGGDPVEPDAGTPDPMDPDSGAMGGSGGDENQGGSSGGGAGGEPEPALECGDLPIPPRTGWMATASHFCNSAAGCTAGDATTSLSTATARAFDSDIGTRWTSGEVQEGDEWFQIDLGAVATIQRITVTTTSAGDGPGHWELRISEGPPDAETPLLDEGDAPSDNLTIDLPEPINGRYVLISQTGSTDVAWWSIHDLTVTCP